MVQAWDSFRIAFKDYAPELFAKPSVQQLGQRIFNVAQKVSSEFCHQDPMIHTQL
jgi:hypothetical protein